VNRDYRIVPIKRRLAVLASGGREVFPLYVRAGQRITHCGRCAKCAERIEGFRHAKVSDPTKCAGRPPRRG
jgi:hypothetical protein